MTEGTFIFLIFMGFLTVMFSEASYMLVSKLSAKIKADNPNFVLDTVVPNLKLDSVFRLARN